MRHQTETLSAREEDMDYLDIPAFLRRQETEEVS